MPALERLRQGDPTSLGHSVHEIRGRSPESKREGQSRGGGDSRGESGHNKSIRTVALRLMVFAAFYWMVTCAFRKSLTCHMNTMCDCSTIRDFVQRKWVSSKEQHWVLD